MAEVLLRPELYCVVPRRLADELVEPLRAHFAEEKVTVIVERRDKRAHVPFELRRQRALHLPRAMPPLPKQFAEHASELRLVQRMPSPGLTYADDSILEVVDSARSDDGVAASELVWRVHARVASRLAKHHGEVVAPSRVDAALGLALDRLQEFDGHQEVEFLHWLDGIVDDS